MPLSMPLKESEHSFLQSVAWEQFQQAAGFDTKRFDGTLAIKRPLPFGKCWIYIPRWDLGARSQELGILDDVINWAKRESAIFIRVEPATGTLPEGWREVEQHMQPQHTTMLDLTKSEEELLAAMHQKTRYNIRLAEKKGVAVRFSRDVKDLDAFLAIKKEVEARSSFRFHSDEYYRTMLKTFSSPCQGEVARPQAGRRGPSEGTDVTADPLPSANAEGLPLSKGEKTSLEIAIAEHNGTPLAVHLLISHVETVTYAHGASSSKQRELMAPHLLQWESIKRAKEQGFKKYDFYGIAPEDAGP